ncbi:MAG TPA: GNAT family N-acetyltransferase [Gemmatimonadales bacterium]
MTPSARQALAQDERAGDTASALVVSCVDPLEHAAEIKRLFVAHERPEFPAFFDRGYPDAVAAGTRSWVGRDGDGRIRAHIAWFSHRFTCDGQVLHGALLGNLMVAPEYRRFWPALALVRRAIRDLRNDGGVDFIYADPNDAAKPVLLAAGLREAGALRRHVLPLGDRGAVTSLGLRAYGLLARLRLGRSPLRVTERAAADALDADGPPPRGDSRALRPIRTPQLYRRRLADFPGDADKWWSFHARGAAGEPVARVLVRGPDARGIVTLSAWHCEPLAQLRFVLSALAGRLQARGVRRLEGWVMGGSPAARELRRAGFFPREERIPVLATACTGPGTAAVAAARDWRILPLDLDR